MSFSESGPSPDPSAEVSPEMQAELAEQVEGAEEEAQQEQVEDTPPNPEEEWSAIQAETVQLEEQIDETTDAVNAARAELGVEPIEDTPPAVSAEKAKLDALRERAQELQEQQETLISPEERARMVEEEKERILQEKVDEALKAFSEFSQADLSSLMQGGKMANGESPSGAVGQLGPENAMTLAKAFVDGARALSDIADKLPDLLKAADAAIEKEAEERVDARIAEAAPDEPVEAEGETAEEVEPAANEAPVEQADADTAA